MYKTRAAARAQRVLEREAVLAEQKHASRIMIAREYGKKHEKHEKKT